MLELESAVTHEPARASSSPELDATRRVLDELFGRPDHRDFSVKFWDGSVDDCAEEPRFTFVLRSRGALRRMLLPPTELSMVEAYLSGDVDIEGDLESAVELASLVRGHLQSPAAVLKLTAHAAALPHDHATAGAEDLRKSELHAGRQHTVSRDRKAVRFHYDLGNDFYALWLDRRMVYSCAYFQRGDEDIDTAQTAKLDHLCRKLRLHPGERLLDIGCGWGGLILHAAQRYGAQALGITLSERQAELARQRIASAGLSDRCRVEVCDYRELGTGSFDKIVSVGMIEHVGRKRLPAYFGVAYRLLAPGGLFLNHGIVDIDATRPQSLRERATERLWRRRTFIGTYVFPDGDLVPAGTVIGEAERAGFEVRDVESLREHYVATLRQWGQRLTARARDAVPLVGEATFRTWRLYMAASAQAFRTAHIGIIQTLLARPDDDGAVRVPRTRADIYASARQ